jgi:hypothetical protein
LASQAKALVDESVSASLPVKLIDVVMLFSLFSLLYPLPESHPCKAASLVLSLLDSLASRHPAPLLPLLSHVRCNGQVPTLVKSLVEFDRDANKTAEAALLLYWETTAIASAAAV